MLGKDSINLKHYLSKKSKVYPITSPRLWVGYLLITLSLACVTNTPVAQISTARPTRTALPTFTNTPIPPTATPVPPPTDTSTPTNTPLATNTPVPTENPTPTATPIPPSATPLPPTNTPLPPPPPPTNTLVPTPTPIPVAISPLTTPTLTPVPGSPSGRYRPSSTEGEANCAHIGVTGVVRDGPDKDDDPIANVTIRVTGEDDYAGPFFGTTSSDGKYAIVIGEYGRVGEIKFRADVYGPGVNTSNEPEWETDEDCHSNNAIQIMKINWSKDND